MKHKPFHQAALLASLTCSLLSASAALGTPNPEPPSGAGQVQRELSKSQRKARRQPRRQNAEHSDAPALPEQDHGDQTDGAAASIPYVPADLESMQIVTGEIIEGEIEDLRAADKQVAIFSSGFGNDFVHLHLLETRFVARTAAEMPIALALTLNASSTEHGQVILRLLNFETGEFETVARAAIGPETQQFNIGEISAMEYVGPEGEIHLSLQQVVAVPLFAHIFRAQVDWLEIGVY